jgi:hypothetical protein
MQSYKGSNNLGVINDGNWAIVFSSTRQAKHPLLFHTIAEAETVAVK